VEILKTASRISFGLFEVDLQTGELWKAGFKIRLQGQPFKVLTMLLSNPGEVVTREELQLKVWDSDTNIDFERALAGAINKIREALNDSADNPRFVETLPKRGYRFIAPVTFVESVSRKPEGGQVTLGASVGGPQEQMLVFPGNAPSTDSLTGSIHYEPPLVFPKEQAAANRLGWSILGLALSGLAVMFLGAILTILWIWQRPTDVAPLRVDQITRDGSISTGPPNMENLLTLATDGDRILTSVMNDGQPELSAIYISTGEIQRLTLPRDLVSSSLADISKDGSKLLLKSHLSSASEQPLWVVPSSGSSALRVGGVLAHDASWMPDGTSILYANGNELAVVKLDDGVSTPFAKLKGRAFWMRWSPDGKLLRFTLMDPVTHTSGLWELGSGGGEPRQVSTTELNRLSACCGTWTADGSAYILQAGDNLWELKGSGRKATAIQLTNGPLRFLSPVAARSGSRIFFMGLAQPFGLQKLDGANGFRAAPSFMADATRVDFSRDGVWVAWTDSNKRLWRARAADGSDKLQLTPEYLEAFMAHWSPDGKQLAVMARAQGKVWRTYLIDAAGGAPQPLLNEDRNAADPGWSSDGNSIVFGREPDLMGKESGSHSIEIVNLETKRTETVPDSEGLFSPRWSPDGRWIAALSLNQKSLMLYDVAQRRWKELASTSAADPIWSKDSKFLYVHAFLANEEPILKVSVPDGAVHVVANLSDFHNRETVNYFFGGLTPANEPLVEPRIGAGNLYTLDLNRQ
jgi:Tol biopolymer transport system component/DNA-binding winged helix-turn-helix (wHTH) protein